MALFTALGDEQLGLLASLGGFTALYAMDRPLRQQGRILPLVALGLVASAAVGELMAGSFLNNLGGAVVVAGLSTLLTFGTRLGPPGPVLFVLVAMLSAHVKSSSALRDLDLPMGGLTLLVAGGAVLAVGVSLASSALARRWSPEEAAADERPLDLRVDRSVRDAVGRIVAGVALAVLASHWWEAFRPHWVVISTMAILQGALDRQFTLVRAIQRVLGTVLGLALFELVLLGEPRGFALVALVMVLQFGIEVVVQRNYVLGLLFITPLALTIATFGQHTSATLTMTGRVLDTLLGAAVALAVLVAVMLGRRWWPPGDERNRD